MDEKRRAPRLKEDNEVTIIVVPGGKNSPKEKVIYDSSKDISVSGARIHAHILLPVNTLLRIDITLKTVHKMITVMGKVKWIKIIYDDESYGEGLEFVNTPDEAIKKLKDYISWKLKNTNLNPV
jgi:hypothetical protein